MLKLFLLLKIYQTHLYNIYRCYKDNISLPMKSVLFFTKAAIFSHILNHVIFRLFSEYFTFLGILFSLMFAMKQKETIKHCNFYYINSLTLIFSFTLPTATFEACLLFFAVSYFNSFISMLASEPLQHIQLCGRRITEMVYCITEI